MVVPGFSPLFFLFFRFFLFPPDSFSRAEISSFARVGLDDTGLTGAGEVTGFNPSSDAISFEDISGHPHILYGNIIRIEDLIQLLQKGGFISF